MAIIVPFSFEKDKEIHVKTLEKREKMQIDYRVIP